MTRNRGLGSKYFILLAVINSIRNPLSGKNFSTSTKKPSKTWRISGAVFPGFGVKILGTNSAGLLSLGVLLGVKTSKNAASRARFVGQTRRYNSYHPSTFLPISVWLHTRSTTFPTTRRETRWSIMPGVSPGPLQVVSRLAYVPVLEGCAGGVGEIDCLIPIWSRAHLSFAGTCGTCVTTRFLDISRGRFTHLAQSDPVLNLEQCTEENPRNEGNARHIPGAEISRTYPRGSHPQRIIIRGRTGHKVVYGSTKNTNKKYRSAKEKQSAGAGE